MSKETKSHAEPSDPGETFDFTKLLGQFKLPGVDFAALVERERKNIEALTKAKTKMRKQLPGDVPRSGGRRKTSAGPTATTGWPIPSRR